MIFHTIIGSKDRIINTFLIIYFRFLPIYFQVDYEVKTIVASQYNSIPILDDWYQYGLCIYLKCMVPLFTLLAVSTFDSIVLLEHSCNIAPFS